MVLLKELGLDIPSWVLVILFHFYQNSSWVFHAAGAGKELLAHFTAAVTHWLLGYE